jgi:hypothetical protein
METGSEEALNFSTMVFSLSLPRNDLRPVDKWRYAVMLEMLR